jgi:cyanophycin synthetase
MATLTPGGTDAPGAAPEPNHAFDDSRRLTGPSRWFAGAAVTLTPRGPLAADAGAHQRWAAAVAEVAAALGWPAPQPLAVVRNSETLLSFAAPAGLLFTATELNEWAWETACRGAALHGFDLAQPWALQTDAKQRLAAATEHVHSRAVTEFNPALAALCQAASAHGLPCLVDDDTVSIGAGSGGLVWPLQPALPEPADLPWMRLHGIPTALVTGSNGKTTTVRLLATMAARAGFSAGSCSTEGITIAGERVAAGDYAGPAGARRVLRDRRVQFAVLETARGGLLRRGLAVQQAEVAVVTNLSADHFGEYGVDSVDDLAEVKLTVARALLGSAVPGTLVLNADDPVLMAAAARLPHAAMARQALFALDFEHPALVALRARGGSTCGVAAGRLRLNLAETRHDLGAVQSLPLAWGGAAMHNIANAAAAALAAAALGLAPAVIAATLQHFGADPRDNAGRLERWMHRGATVLIDYAHNPDGLAQLLRVARAQQSRPGSRLGLLLGQAGNRDDKAIADLAHTAAGFAPDLILVKELPAMQRGRAPGEVTGLLRAALLSAGLAPERIAPQADEQAAALALLAWAAAGDVVVLALHTAAVREQIVALLAAG